MAADIDLSDAHVETVRARISCAKWPGKIHTADVLYAVKSNGERYGYFPDGCEESRSACSVCDTCVEWCTHYFMCHDFAPPVLYLPNTFPHR